MPVTNVAAYGINHAKAYKGQVADIQLSNAISKLNPTDEVIEFGTGVVRNPEGGSNAVKPPVAESVSGDIVGIVKREFINATRDGELMGAVPKKEFTCLTMGTIYVLTLEKVVQGEQVFLRVGETGTGNFCKSAGADGTLSVEFNGAKFAENAEANTLVKISINLGAV